MRFLTNDAWSRLDTAQAGPSATPTWKYSYNYDRFGNRKNQNLIAGAQGYQTLLTIDPNTNRISGNAYDAAGNMTGDGSHTYAFDAENRIKTVDTTGATYTYDGTNLRVKKVVGSTTTVYLYSGGGLIAEYAGGAAAANPSKEYIGGGGSAVASVSGGVVTYYHADHLSARVETDGTGGVTRTFGHYPYGEDWYETGASDKWKFTSYERDAESQLNYAMNRFHSGQYGRFMSMDPLAGHLATPQSLNRYAYAMNDPVNQIDPTGLDCNIYNPDLGDQSCDGAGSNSDWGAEGPWGDGSSWGGWGERRSSSNLLNSPVANPDFEGWDTVHDDSWAVDPGPRGPTGKVLRQLLKIISKVDCIKFLKSVIQNTTLLAAQQPDASKLDSGAQQVFDTNPYSILTQVMNAQLINEPGQDPQHAGYHTRALAGPFDFPKTISLYSGYFRASTNVQAQILVHEGTHLIYPFSDTQLAAAAGKPGNSSDQSSANYQHELEKHCK